MKLKLDQIRKDDTAQPRAMLNTDHIKDLSDALEDGGDLTPVDVFHDGFSYWLADGFHRWSAYHRTKRDEIPVTVHEGDLRAAVLWSITANAKHAALKLTRDEKRAGVTRLLKDEEWGQWSDREIAKRAGVHHETVGKARAELSGENRQIERKVRRGESEYVMRTPAPKADPPAAPTPSADLSGYLVPRPKPGYNPARHADNPKPELEEEVLKDEPETAFDMTPYPPAAPLGNPADIRVRPADPSKQRPFMRVFPAAGAFNRFSDDVIVDALLSVENRTPQDGALEEEFQTAMEKMRRCMARAELERKTVSV